MKLNEIVAGNRVGSENENLGGVKVGILGAGKMAELHLNVLRKLHGVRIVGICSRSMEKAKAVAARHQIASVYESVEDLVELARPDAVVVTVSHSATVEITAELLRRKVPCLIEKPAGLCIADTQYLADLADKADCYNMVALNRRFYGGLNQAYLALLHYGPIRGVMIEAHEPIQSMRNRLQFRSSLYDRWLVANTIHAVDLFRMFGGEVDQLTSYTQSQSETLGDGFGASFTFKRGGSGVFASYWNSAGGMALKVFGNGIAAEFDSLESGFIRYANGRRIKLDPDQVDGPFKPGLYDQMVRFLQDVKEARSTSFPASDLRDNVETMKLVEAIYGHPGAALTN